MENFYHVCFSTKKEAMFRNHEDHVAFVNCLALALYSTNAKLYVDTEMSNHVHLGIGTEDPRPFIRNLRQRYTRHFNEKYFRSGRLGELETFCLKLEGHYHLLTAWSYILRNGMHHGICLLPFAYEYSTIRHIFKKAYHWDSTDTLITSRNEIAGCLPRRSEFPDEYVMDGAGMFVGECFTQIALVEASYGSPRSFDYFMTRLSSDASGEKWKEEQMKDNCGMDPITLEGMEALVVGGDKEDIGRIMKNEYGKFDDRRPSDEVICELIDKEYVPRFRRKSVYQLTDDEKVLIAKDLLNSRYLPADQISRCLVME